MQATVIYTFPLVPPLVRPLCTFLQEGPEGVFGFGIKALPDPSTKSHGTFSFFEVNVEKGTVSHQSASLSSGRISKMCLCYDGVKNAWVVGMEYTREGIKLYEISSDFNHVWNNIFTLDEEDVGLGKKTILTLWQQSRFYPLLFTVADVAEISDAQMYWTQWKAFSSTALKSADPIGYCDIAVPQRTDGGCLVFVCKRVFDQEPAELELRQGPGNWQIGIDAYGFDGTLLHHETISDRAFPIRNSELPEEDLLNWLAVSIYPMDGSLTLDNGNHLWVAALMLRDVSAVSEDHTGRERQKMEGGLYCVDTLGRIVQQERNLLGTQVSMCGCGKDVIGTDLFEEQRRLWKWSPLLGAERKIDQTLNPDAKRVTVIAAKRLEGKDTEYFWCVEEYSHGIRVSRRESVQLQELASVWYEGVSLLDTRVGPYIEEKIPHSLKAYQDSLFIIGIDQSKKLILLRFLI